MTRNTNPDHRRIMACAYPDCTTIVRTDSQTRVCAKHSHNAGYCQCKHCTGTDPHVAGWKKTITLPDMPWDVSA